MFKKIIEKYGLDINGDWNKMEMLHLGLPPDIVEKVMKNIED